MNDKQVFISYKSEERDEAVFVKEILEKNGISCWLDSSDVAGGTNYAEEINTALLNASAIVLILSKKALSSEFIKREIILATEYSKPVVAFALEECDMLAEFDFDLPPEKRYNAFENKDKAIEEMVSQLKSIVEASEEDLYDVKKFFRERRKFMKDKKEREERIRQKEKAKKEDPAPKEKKLCKRFPINLTPYSKSYSKEKNVRLSLNIHTAFIVLASLTAALLMLMVEFSGFHPSLFKGIVLSIVMAFVLFVAEEALAGLASYLIGKIKNKAAVVILSLITGNSIAWSCFLLFIRFYNEFMKMVM